MPLSNRDTKLILRIGVSLIATLSLALAVRIVFENQELEKLVPATRTRTMLLFLAPMTSLAILYYTLAVKSFNTRPLQFELLALGGLALIFVGIVAPMVFGEMQAIPAQDCKWLRKCPDELVWVPYPHLSLGICAAGALALAGALWTQLKKRAMPADAHPV